MTLLGDIVGVALGALVLILAFYGLLLLGGIGLYVLQALGMYTLAQRRGIRQGWMAWVPVLSLWTLGSLSDQYQYVVKRRFRSRRKWLLILSAAGAVLGMVFSGLYTAGVVSALMGLPQIQDYQEFLYMFRYQPVLVAAAGVWALTAAVQVLLTLLRWGCLYDVYASCRPEKKVLYLVLSILLPVTVPFFLFTCREKDGGMPPRKMQNAECKMQN